MKKVGMSMNKDNMSVHIGKVCQEYRNKNKEHYKELNRKYSREYRKRKRGQ